MSVKTLLSDSGRLDVSALPNIQSDSEETLSVVAALGAHGLNQSKLLDQIFSTSFTSVTPRRGIAAAFVEGDDSAVMAEVCHHTIVLDVEPFDGPQRERDEQRERAAHLAMSLADVVIFIARMTDLHRVESNGVSSLRSNFTEMLLMQTDGIIPTPLGKRPFIVVVRDHEPDILSRQEIVSGFLHEVQGMYNSVAKPSGSPSRITELFEFEFILLPFENLQPEEYNKVVSDLQANLLDPAADDYIFEGGAFLRSNPEKLAEVAEKAWKKLEKEQVQDMPNDKELMSTFDCDNAMRRVYQKYQRGVRVWRRETDGGVIIEKFGAAASDMVEETIAVYEQDAAAHKGSKAFKRKREELNDLLDADLYSLFVTQIAKLREVTYRLFKDKLDAIGEDEARLDKAVNTTLKESQKYFKTNADALRPRNCSWRYDNDIKELVTQMREDATERLQRARLADYQGNIGRRNRRFRSRNALSESKRQPIQLSLHYLNPAPFGWKDSRYEKLSIDDGLQYDKGVPIFGGGKDDNVSVPLAPSRDSSWHRRNQDFIYSERR